MGIHEKIREAADPTTAPERLERLCLSGDRDVLEKIVRNPNTSRKLLSKLVHSKLENVQFAFVMNKQTSSGILTVLSNSTYPSVLVKVAEHKNTPAIILDRLSRLNEPDMIPGQEDREVYVTHRWCMIALGVGSNPSAAPKTLERLVDHPDKYMITRLSGNRNLPKELQMALVRKDSSAYSRLIDRKDLEEEVFVHIAKHASRHIKLIAARSESAPEWYLLEMLNQGEDHDAKHALRQISGNSAATIVVVEAAAERFLEMPWDKNDVQDYRHMMDIANSLAGRTNTTQEIADSMPAWAIGKWALGHWYGTHPEWETIVALHLEWQGDLKSLVETTASLTSKK